MTTADAPVGTDIAVLVETTPVIVLQDPKKRDELIAHIEAEVAAFVPDLSTEASRKVVASLAYKISRTKTAIDKAGLKLTEDHRAEVARVNAERARLSSKLDDLRDLARKPLTEWEAAEEQRVEHGKRVVASIDTLAVVRSDTTAAEVAGRIDHLRDLEPNAEELGDFFDLVKDSRARCLAALEQIHPQLVQAEADRAELAKLRAAAAEREAKAAEEAAARLMAENERIAAEREAQRIAAAAEEARQQAQRKADAEQRRRDEAHAAELARIEAERQQEAAESRRREEAAAAERKAREDAEAARLADAEHRDRCMSLAVASIMFVGGVTRAKAIQIVAAIENGDIPHLSIKF